MLLVYTGEPMPKEFSRSLFLAGPTPRSSEVQSWRPEALRILKERGYDGIVFIPEYHEGGPRPSYDRQVAWEHQAINMSDCVMFWVPRDLDKLPAFTTNVEFGWLVDSGKIVFGAPKNAPKNDYLRFFARKRRVPTSESLEDTVTSALELIGDGSSRCDGAKEVPLYVWRTTAFQNWYRAQSRVGNKLISAELVCSIRPRSNFVYAWVMRANVFIQKENRNKTNEVLISRADISSVVMYRRAENILDTTIVLGREFRTPASNSECFIYENSGGSSVKPGIDALTVAVEEVHEETGLLVSKERVRFHLARQLMGTFSAHKSHLFSIELNDEELARLIRDKEGGVYHSADDLKNHPTGECVWLEIFKLKDLLSNDLVDWCTLGMIFQVLHEAK